jgi:hypothetical protein
MAFLEGLATSCGLGVHYAREKWGGGKGGKKWSSELMAGAGDTQPLVLVS